MARWGQTDQQPRNKAATAASGRAKTPPKLRWFVFAWGKFALASGTFVVAWAGVVFAWGN